MFTTDPDRMLPIAEEDHKRQLGFDLCATPDVVGACKRLTLRSCVRFKHAAKMSELIFLPQRCAGTWADFFPRLAPVSRRPGPKTQRQKTRTRENGSGFRRPGQDCLVVKHVNIYGNRCPVSKKKSKQDVWILDFGVRKNSPSLDFA